MTERIDATGDHELAAVAEELRRREPIFHRREFGRTRRDVEAMTDPDFREVGASGRRYSREFVLLLLETRKEDASAFLWRTEDFQCLRIAPDHFLVTYTLFQGERVTRRATIWRRAAGAWRILYHQGTIATEV